MSFDPSSRVKAESFCPDLWKMLSFFSSEPLLNLSPVNLYSVYLYPVNLHPMNIFFRWASVRWGSVLWAFARWASDELLSRIRSESSGNPQTLVGIHHWAPSCLSTFVFKCNLLKKKKKVAKEKKRNGLAVCCCLFSNKSGVSAFWGSRTWSGARVKVTSSNRNQVTWWAARPRTARASALPARISFRRCSLFFSFSLSLRVLIYFYYLVSWRVL